MTLQTQKELERVLLINLLKDINDSAYLRPEHGKRAVRLLEHVATTDMCEAQLIKQNIMAANKRDLLN